MKSALVILLSLISLTVSAQRSFDFDTASGVIKPVNGVGQPPLKGLSNTKMFSYLKDAGIPYSRLHDVGGSFGANVFADIPNIFRDFSADENNPKNYDFTFTDLLVKALVENGVEPYYRLGVSIENSSTVKAYRIYPPEDFAKWARICEHIIMHYNEGWADGFHMNISHWEIWNEPENRVNVNENPMWRGTWEQFLELYGTASTYLKAKFPHLKIGGYGSCGFSAINGEWVKEANCDPRKGHFVDCFLSFLEHARKEDWPLDFFSAHSYGLPANAIRQMAYARAKLDEYGFVNTELSVNEWLPRPSLEKTGTALAAAEIAAEMIGFQNTRVDDAEIYDARCRGGLYCPLFEPETGQPRKAYYSFIMFNELRKLGNAVHVPECPEGVYVCGATDLSGKAAVMISNISGSKWKHAFDFDGYKIASVWGIDEKNGYHQASGLPGRIPSGTVWLVELKKAP